MLKTQICVTRPQCAKQAEQFKQPYHLHSHSGCPAIRRVNCLMVSMMAINNCIIVSTIAGVLNIFRTFFFIMNGHRRREPNFNVILPFVVSIRLSALTQEEVFILGCTYIHISAILIFQQNYLSQRRQLKHPSPLSQKQLLFVPCLYFVGVSIKELLQIGEKAVMWPYHWRRYSGEAEEYHTIDQANFQ